MPKKALLLLLVVALAGNVAAQTTYLPFGSETYHLLDRIETRSGQLTRDFYTGSKPIPRSGAVQFLSEHRQKARTLNLSATDRYNIDRTIAVSGEWTEDGNGAQDSRTPWFRTFYKKKTDFVYVKTKDFFLAVNPVISTVGLYEKNSLRNKTHLSSSRGVEFRGWIAKKVGFYSYLADNQEQPPDFANQYIVRQRAVPGVDFYTLRTNHYDYLIARGYVDFALLKDRLQVTFGHDKHFIGDGMRSLLLSDFAASATFLRLNTKLWKLNYQNLYLELTPQFVWRSGDNRLPRKYATIHSLSMHVTKWLNIGVYESVMFSHRDRYDLNYLVPVMFYHSLANGLGSADADNVNLGFTFKAIALKHFQFYGQFLLDDFGSGGKGWWGNRYGMQLGGKYFDAFTVKNLDLQAEVNIMRPYTYSHSDSTANYTHYNQPLAHPLGAGFMELTGQARYQTARDLFITLKGMYYVQGVDTGAANFGSNIFSNNHTRSAEYGVGMIHGVRTTGMLLNLNLSYMLWENVFLDLGATHRRQYYANKVAPVFTTSYIYAGFRLNIPRREYDFY